MKKISTLAGIVVIVAVSVVLLGGAFAYQYFAPKDFNVAQNTEKPIGGDKDSHGCLIAAGYSWCEVKNKCLRIWEEKCGADQTAGWKTYTNSEYGFELKYPESREIKKENNSILIDKIQTPKGFPYSIYIFEKNNAQTLLDFYNTNRDTIRTAEGEGIIKESDITPININTYKGLDVYFSYMEASRKKIFIENNSGNIIVDFVFNTDGDLLSPEQQNILNTFKFTNN